MAHINAWLLRTGIALIIGVVASQQRMSQLHEFRRKVLVLLHELCHLPEAVDVKAVRTAIIEEFSNEFEIVFLDNKGKGEYNIDSLCPRVSRVSVRFARSSKIIAFFSPLFHAGA